MVYVVPRAAAGAVLKLALPLARVRAPRRSAIVQGAERRQQFASLTLTERDTKNKLKASETRHDRFARDARIGDFVAALRQLKKVSSLISSLYID